GLLGGLFGGMRANGGPVQSGKAYVVGEKRPELFVPSSPGYIIPRIPRAAAAGNSAGGPIDLRISLDDELLNLTIDNRAAGVSANVTRTGLGEYDRKLPSRNAEQDARFR